MMPTVFSSLLNNDFQVFRRERTPDGQGGFPFDLVQLPGTVRGRIRPASSTEREQALQEERNITHVFYALAGTDIARGDRLAVVNGSPPLVVDVEGVREPSKAGEHLEVDCREQQLETSEEGS